MSFIELKNVSKSYKNKKIYEDFSIDIEKGKFISFIGSYGSGKTTILKLIAGIEDIDNGEILINSCLPQELKEKQKIGFVFQGPMLLPWRRVLDNITLPTEFNDNKNTEKAIEMLKLVDLEEKKNNFPYELSGGMQRIVSILRAIMLDPEVLLMDEPLSAIDEINRDELHEKLISIHNKDKKTTILVTHSIHEAVYLSDEIYILGGSPTKIMKKVIPNNPRKYEKKFSTETMQQVSEIREELRKAVNYA